MNQVWASSLINTLCRVGVCHVCIAPGSRSTPLVLAISQCRSLTTTVHIDERGLAYYALGLAKSSESPVAIVTTSGTAVGNLLPAVMEAYNDEIPLLFLTADRPPKLHGIGANQTIAQDQVFAPYVQAQMNCDSPKSDADINAMIQNLHDTLSHIDSGPVHINCSFREPFFDKDDMSADGPIDSGEFPINKLSPQDPVTIPGEIADAMRPLVMIGQLDSDLDRKVVGDWIRTLKVPVILDVLSGIRKINCPGMVTNYAQILDRLSPPDAVIHVGGRFVSKELLHYIDLLSDMPYWHLHNRHRRYDPVRRVTHDIQGELSQLLGELEVLWQAVWGGDVVADGQVGGDLADGGLGGMFSELDVVQELGRRLGEEDVIFVGNSLAIRVFDEQFYPNQPVLTYANRGVSGIDGNIATAVGVAAGRGQRVTAVVGDLTALHDLSSFQLLRRSKNPVVLIIFNNNGGKLFERLPIASCKDVFEEYFTTPQNLNFDHISAQFELNYHQVKDLDSFSTAYDAARNTQVSTVIEVII